MARYRFAHASEVRAPANDVFAAVADTAAWERWWRGLRTRVLEAGQTTPAGPLGRVQSFSVRAPVGYGVAVTATIEPGRRPRSLHAEMSGHLDGHGWLWVEPLTGDRSLLRLQMEVATTARWMRLFDPLLRPLFVASHRVVVRRAVDGLSRRLNGAGSGQ